MEEASERAGEASGDVADVVEQIGREQHAVVTRAQLMAHGASADWIEHQVRMGRLLRVAPRTYRPWGTQRTWKLKASAAVHSAKAPARVPQERRVPLGAHRPEGVPGVHRRHGPPAPAAEEAAWVQFHETRFFDLAQPAVLDRIAVTGVARTILDCCAVLNSYKECLELLDEARRRRLVDWDELWECHLLHTGRGQPGFGRFRRLLFDRDGEVPPDSVFVRRVATLLEGAGVPAPLFDFPVLDDDYRIDLVWFPDTLRVGLECHGAIAHAHEAARENDAIRGNRIRLDGWMLLEVTWGRFRDDPAGIVAEVKAALGLAP